MQDQERLTHDDYQRRFFDKNFEFWKQPVPAEIEQRTRAIVQAAQLTAQSRVLDVGTGMGVLIEHFLENGVAEQNIVGCDLSANMLAEAKKRYGSARFWQGDVVELPETLGPFDAVFFNACFGNIFDQTGALKAVVAVLAADGRIVISHPLGNKFVDQLRREDPQLVLTLMPCHEKLNEWCARFGLVLTNFTDEPDFYLAVLQRK